MPFQRIVHTSRTPRRVLIQGPPNSGKTHSFLTWPRQNDKGEGHAHYLAFPGEKGWETIPTDLPDLVADRWGSSPAEKTSSSSVVAAVEKRVFEALAVPGLVSFCGDGLHKYYSYVLDAVTGGSLFRGEEFEPKLYAPAHEHFKFFLDRVMDTPTPYIVFTCWDGREPDSFQQTQVLKAKAPSHVWPDLPGKMAKRVMGEFSVVLYAKLTHKSDGGIETASWQLKPHGDVWGAFIKAPEEVVARLPLTIPQDFKALEKALQGAWEAPKVKPAPPRG